LLPILRTPTSPLFPYTTLFRSGVVISKDAQPGEMISPISAGGGFTRTGIATLVDMDSREIEVDVNEAFINRVQPNQRTEAVLDRSEEHTSELQSRENLVCRLLL